MKSIVIMTYYQLMHAMLLAMDMQTKPLLYVWTPYLRISDETIERIDQTGLFSRVVEISSKEFVRGFTDEINQTEGFTEEEIDKIGNSIFEKYLTPYFEKKFQYSDTDEEIYIYNDLQYYFYYVANHFKKIIGVEDGYCSLEQQKDIHIPKGTLSLALPFAPKYYPKILYRHPNYQKLISSVHFKDEGAFSCPIEVRDFQDMLEKHHGPFSKALQTIFSKQIPDVVNNSILYLAQPLDRAMYCTQTEYYMYVRKVLRELKGRADRVYIKPHPAEQLEMKLFESETVEILDKDFPIEVLNYSGVHFDEVVTLGSTALDLISCASQKTKLYNGEVTIDLVKQHIQERIDGEKLQFHFYVQIEGFETEDYINLYSYFVSDSKNHIPVVTAVAEKAELENARSFFDPVNYKNQIRKYKKSNPIAYFENRKQINTLSEIYKECKIEWLVKDSFEEYEIAGSFIADDKVSDYFMLTGTKTNGIRITRDFVQRVKDSVVAGYSFMEHTYTDNGSRIVLNEPLSSWGAYLRNKIWHRGMLEKVLTHNTLDFSLQERVIWIYRESLEKSLHVDLFTPLEYFPDKEEGLSYYQNQLTDLINDAFPDESEKEEYLADGCARIVCHYMNLLRIQYKTNILTRINNDTEDFIEQGDIPLSVKTGMYRMLYYDAVKRVLTDRNRRPMLEKVVYLRVRKTLLKMINSGVLDKLETFRDIV